MWAAECQSLAHFVFLLCFMLQDSHGSPDCAPTDIIQKDIYLFKILILAWKNRAHHKELAEMWTYKSRTVAGHCWGNILHGKTDSLSHKERTTLEGKMDCAEEMGLTRTDHKGGASLLWFYFSVHTHRTPCSITQHHYDRSQRDCECKNIKASQGESIKDLSEWLKGLLWLRLLHLLGASRAAPI